MQEKDRLLCVRSDHVLCLGVNGSEFQSAFIKIKNEKIEKIIPDEGGQRR